MKMCKFNAIFCPQAVWHIFLQHRNENLPQIRRRFGNEIRQWITKSFIEGVSIIFSSSSRMLRELDFINYFSPTSAIWEFPLFKLTFKYLKHFKESDDAWKWKIFGSKFYANFMQFKMVISALFAFDLLHSIQNISSSMCNKSFYAFSS